MGLLTPLHWFFGILSLVMFIVELWAFIDAAIRPKAGYVSADKQTKNLWLVLLGLALVVTAVFRVGFLSIFGIAGLIVALVYLADVRPAVRQVQGKGGSSYGPYGP